MKLQKITLTPDLARHLLEGNTDNRRIKSGVLAKYIKDIRNGRWKVNGETIQVSKKGRLLNGQHRCLAVIETGIPIETFLVEGLDDNVMDTIDKGTSRQPHDTLYMRGEKNAMRLAAILRVLCASEGGVINPTRQSRYTTGDILDMLKIVPEARKATNLTAEELSLFSPAYYGALITMGYKADVAQTDLFRTKITKGQPMTGLDDPVLSLRNYMIRTSKTNMTMTEQVSILVQTWNAYWDEKPLKFFRDMQKVPVMRPYDQK